MKVSRLGSKRSAASVGQSQRPPVKAAVFMLSPSAVLMVVSPRCDPGFISE